MQMGSPTIAFTPTLLVNNLEILVQPDFLDALRDLRGY